MGRFKEYTDQDAKPHRLVVTLKNLGHENIRVQWNDALSRARGWVIITNLITWKRFSGTVPNIIKDLKKNHGTTIHPGSNDTST